MSAPAVSISSARAPSPALVRAVAVAGATLFAASFAVAVWLFVSLGSPPAAAPLWPAVLINTALFGLFGLHHSLLAREPIKARVARVLSPALERPAYVWVASLLFIGVCLAWQPIAGVVYVLPGPWSWLAGMAQLAGALVTLDAARRIDVRVLAGLVPEPAPAGDGAAAPLVATGSYRLVRHPIYLGWVLLVWGASDMTAGRLVFAAVSTAYLALAVPLEERSLRRRLGPAYDAYKRQVRWRIVPGIY